MDRDWSRFGHPHSRWILERRANAVVWTARDLTKRGSHVHYAWNASRWMIDSLNLKEISFPLVREAEVVAVVGLVGEA